MFYVEKEINMNIAYRVLISLSALLILSAAGLSAQEDGKYGNMVMDAVQKMDDSNYPAAEAILKQVVDEAPDEDAAWYYLSMIAFAKGEAELAEAYLQNAVELDSGNFWYRHRLARLYALTERPELTISMYENLLEDFPEKSDLYLDLVELYYGQQEYQKALDTLQEVENVFGPNETIAIYRYDLYRMMGKHEEAFASLTEYNSKYSSPYVLSILADMEMGLYNDSTALAYYNEALDLAPDYGPAILGKAETLRMTRKYPEYFETLYRYAENQSTPPASKTDYIMALVQRGDPKFVLNFLPQIDSAMNMVMDQHPKDSLVNESASVYYYYTGRNDKAKEILMENLKTYPNSFGAHANLMDLLSVTEDWEEVSVQGRAAYEKFPDEIAFLEYASMGDYYLKRYDKVIEICDKVLEVAPEDSARALSAWSTMGDAYHALGDSKKAYKAYNKALKINPDHIYVLNNYAYFLSEDGKKLKKALSMSRKTIEKESDNATYLDTYAWILHLLGNDAEAKVFFKRAMLCGGKDSSVILDHYADVLYALEEYDLAFVYWNMALQKDAGELPGLKDKVARKRSERVKQ